MQRTRKTGIHTRGVKKTIKKLVSANTSRSAIGVKDYRYDIMADLICQENWRAKEALVTLDKDIKVRTRGYD